MTLENCKRLLKHFEGLADGSIQHPEGHKDWGLVRKQAEVNAKSMRERIATKGNLPKYSAIKETPKATSKATSKK